MKKYFTKLISMLIVSLTVFGTVFVPVVSAGPLNQPACTLTGVAYRDFNADALQGANEPGVPGIVVTAYNAAGTSVASVTTGDDGSYSISVTEGVEVRLEFTGLPDFMRYGPDGASSSTSVVFVTCAPGATPVNIALANPGQHCDLNPDVITSCFVLGDQLTDANSDLDTVISAPYGAGSTDVTSPPTGRFDTPAHDTLAVANQVGSVWGLAYRRQTETIYAGAFLKRHTGFGPNGAGAIYAIDSAGNVSLFTTLDAAPATPVHTDGTEYADHPGVNPWVVDREAYDWVGKAGLGDMTMSDDDSTLYVVNLFDRRLYSIPVDNPGGISSVALPTSLPGCPSTGDARPFAVEFHDGQVFVGITCTAESNQNAASLNGYVYAAAPGSGSFSLVLSFPLDYPRTCIDQAFSAACETAHPADWLPWSPTMQTTYFNGTVITYPQPWLSDIEFDNNGDMIIGIRDRFGDQMGNDAFSPVLNDDNLYLAITGGDTLRACTDGAGWAIEANGSCGGITTAGAAPTGTGPGTPGGEYYFAESLANRHDELSMGSVLQVPGQPEHVNTIFDPVPVGDELFDGGLRWFDNTTGEVTQAYRIYNGTQGSQQVFGKANGLGGLEAICPPAPIEIGNRVWFDLNNNGQQDPGEASIPGVTVRLYDAAGNLIAETVTNADGEYLFTSTDDGVLFNTDYVVRLDNPDDFADGGPLFEWFLTNSGLGRDSIDSDALLSTGFPTINLTTGDPGDNNHTYDFGFVNQVLTPPPPTSPPGDSDGGDDADSGELAVSGGPPGLNMNKSVNPPFAQIGDTVTWTITVRNNGGSALDNITISDTIPDGMEIVSARSSRGNVSVSGRQITLTVGTLGPGETVTVNVETRLLDVPNAPLIYINSAFADGASATAQVVRASQLVQTGETPWWRDPLIAASTIALMGGIGVFILRRRRLPQT